MKIKDILSEDIAPLVAKQHMEPTSEYDAFFNSQATKISDQNREYYAKYFRDFFEEEITPVFTTTDNAEPTDAIDWDNKPPEDSLQSPGYRGQQNALHKAGVPHDKNVASYDTTSNALRYAKVQSKMQNSLDL